MVYAKTHANPVMVELIMCGAIPGIGRCEMVAAAVMQERTGTPALVRMPVTYCNRCGNQLIRDWYAVEDLGQLLVRIGAGPDDQGDREPVELVCAHCALLAGAQGETVHALIGGDR